MAVVHFRETTGRSGSEDFETRREASRTFQALTDHARNGQDVVRDYIETPRRGDPFVYFDGTGTEHKDEKLRCVRIHVEQADEDSYENWKVLAEYRGINDPTFEPPEVECDTHPYQVAKLKDTQDVVYKNSAGDPFEGGRLIDDDRFTITITRNITAAAWNILEIRPYQNSLNERTFLPVRFPDGLKPGTCKLKMKAKLIWYPGNRETFYWRRTAVIEYRPEGWVGKVRDAGYRAIVAGKFGGKPQPVVGENGARPTHPVLLDGTGKQLPHGDPPVTLEFNDYVTKNWDPLDLGF